MILVKKITDGKIVYEPIAIEDAALEKRENLAFSDIRDMHQLDAYELSQKEVEFPHPKSKSDKLMDILPYLGEEDKHDMVEMIINHSSDYRGLDVITVLPYLSEKDSNLLFKAALTDPYLGENVNPYNVGAYATESFMDSLVDEYIEGKYPDAKFDAVYPYMNHKTVKKLFQYMLMKECSLSK